MKFARFTALSCEKHSRKTIETWVNPDHINCIMEHPEDKNRSGIVFTNPDMAIEVALSPAAVVKTIEAMYGRS